MEAIWIISLQDMNENHNKTHVLGPTSLSWESVPVILLKNIFEFGFNMGSISFIQGILVEVLAGGL